MGVRQWLWSVLSKGDAPEQDPDRFVEVTVVSYPQSQLAVALLKRNQIEAIAVAQARIPGWAAVIDSASIRVRARDVDAARDVLAGTV
jgi:hypothetical protein